MTQRSDDYASYMERRLAVCSGATVVLASFVVATRKHELRGETGVATERDINAVLEHDQASGEW
ncbi:hypothetical protein [Burkholderia cepacia]|uniref:hypothetical protein n=1 Tax=Burkholderia cepacia TaxID=292 RepID=UPI0012956D4B|nr:hypothetical protein [Burkholderia cepacia]QFS37613.1 hypothetical protein BURCE16_12795 [Burkholderia cepacia]